MNLQYSTNLRLKSFRFFALQILSRAQGQLNSLAGQMASTKAMPEATTSGQSGVACLDGGSSAVQGIPQSDVGILMASVLQPQQQQQLLQQPLTNGAVNSTAPVPVPVPVPMPVQLDSNTAITVNDNVNACNGSGIFVLQQKAPIQQHVNTAAVANSVPVLVRHRRRLLILFMFMNLFT